MTSSECVMLQIVQNPDHNYYAFFYLCTKGWIVPTAWIHWTKGSILSQVGQDFVTLLRALYNL